MHYAEHHQDWLEHDGKTVKIDGLAYRIQVRTWKARYPYEYQAISVDAVPVNKNSKHYREVKRQLGDDWTTSVLDSEIELQVDLLTQLAA